MSVTTYIAIDGGGTKTEGALFTAAGDILLRARRAAMETMEEAQDTRYVLDVLRLNYSDRFGKILDA